MNDRTRNGREAPASGEDSPRNGTGRATRGVPAASGRHPVSAAGMPVFMALVLDVAGALATHESQDAVTTFIWHMLERDYQIYVCSSTTKEAGSDVLRREDFVHPRLAWLTGVMPPSEEQVARMPALVSSATLWITDDAILQRWVRERNAEFVSLGDKTASFVPDLQIASWGELGNLLDPTAHAARQIADAAEELRNSRPAGPIVMGIGGPPESGLPRLALEVKRALEEREFPLVEVIDVSPLFPEDDSAFASAPAFPEESAPHWLVGAVLLPLSKGGSVYIEKRPKQVPAELQGVFPLYMSKESALLLYGETVFHRAIRAYLDLAILVEVDAAETARRLYGIAEGETFDASFRTQYLERDGRAYEAYLKANQVVERADVHIDGNSPRCFRVVSAESHTN